MLINADFEQFAALKPEQYTWVPSPQAGVERVMLDRIGVEKARATSVVRYAADSHFPRHEHPGGEEILVLSGVFSDELGDYPQGWYLRNPPGSSHQPFSLPGAVIFVKLQQMPATDQTQVRIDTRSPAAWQQLNHRSVCPLFSSSVEQVCLLRLPGDEVVLQHSEGGAELLILEGSVRHHDQLYPAGSWLRLPAKLPAQVYAGPEGVMCYLKTGHLAGLAISDAHEV